MKGVALCTSDGTKGRMWMIQWPFLAMHRVIDIPTEHFTSLVTANVNNQALQDRTAIMCFYKI